MKLTLTSLNATWVHVDTEPGIAQELYDRLSFDVPGAKYMPAFKRRMWDGKIHLYDKRKNIIHKGLTHYIESYTEENQYKILKNYSNVAYEQSVADEFVSNLKCYSGNEPLEIRDYQLDAIKRAITSKRFIALSPTGSGKSLIIASIIKFYYEKIDGKILLICPTTSLVEQMSSDIKEYFPDWESEKKITKIYSGTERFDRKIVISTWQSIYDNPQSYFEDFEVVIGDETHLYSAKEISKLFEKCVNASHRYGFTGTLSGEKLHQLQLEGLFGKAFQITTTSQLISKKQLSSFNINALLLGYSPETRKVAKGFDWEGEVSFLLAHEKRNKFISKLATSLKGNTLVLFSRVDAHGKPLFEQIKKMTDKPVHFVYGGTETQIREDIRKSIENANNGIIVASSQIFSTGINIPSLQNIIFTHPSKSRVRTLQSIGRVLRLSKNKEGPSVLYDIVDDMCINNHKNFAYKHFSERVKVYASEDFDYQIIDIRLE
jgi:superfamily II DNA or RNA helicase